MKGFTLYERVGLIVTIGAVAAIAFSSLQYAQKSKPTGDMQEGWKEATATVFWVGEKASDENGYIANDASAWDENWQTSYGGVDYPNDRCGFLPCAFTPKENAFYVALPYDDLGEDDTRKTNAARIPGNIATATESVLKNRWVEVQSGRTSCYGQWEDVGPFEEDDIEYVFGAAKKPLNQEGEKAGIDLSPAMRDCLGLDDLAQVRWRHVEFDTVPNGPWKEMVTSLRPTNDAPVWSR